MKTISAISLSVLLAGLLIGCGQSASPGGTAASDRTASSGAGADHEEAGHAEEEGEEPSLELTPQQIADAGLELLAAGPARIHESLPLYGVVTPNATNVRQVSARYPGTLRNVAKNFGDPVRQGEVLATIESNESLQAYNVTAPLTGVVTARDANPGEQTAERSLFTVADLSTVWVELSVFPRDIGKVALGQTVRVVGADNAETAEGRVIWVAPFGTAANQTLSVRVLLENTDGHWAPGLYVTAQLSLAETDVPVAVRNTALQTIEDDTVVFVRGEHGFEARPVQTGRSDGEHTEIVTGLAAGDSYVAANSFILKAELGKGEAEHGH